MTFRNATDALGREAKQYVPRSAREERAGIRRRRNSHRHSATPVKAIDTNGAGDMFAGLYLYVR